MAVGPAAFWPRAKLRAILVRRTFPIIGRIVPPCAIPKLAAPSPATSARQICGDASPDRFLRLRWHRHHRRNLRQCSILAQFADEAAARAAAPSPTRSTRPTRSVRRDQPHGRDRRTSKADRLHHPGQHAEVLARSIEDRLQGHPAGHVRHLRASRSRSSSNMKSNHRIGRFVGRFSKSKEYDRPHRRDRLQRWRMTTARATRDLARGRRDPGRRQPQRQDPDLALPGHAARPEGGELPAHSRKTSTAGKLPAGAAAASFKAKMLRPDHPAGTPRPRSATNAGRIQRYASLDRELPQRSQRSREAMMRRGGIRLAVDHAPSRSRRSRRRSCGICGRIGWRIDFRWVCRARLEGAGRAAFGGRNAAVSSHAS